MARILQVTEAKETRTAPLLADSRASPMSFWSMSQRLDHDRVEWVLGNLLFLKRGKKGVACVTPSYATPFFWLCLADSCSSSLAESC